MKKLFFIILVGVMFSHLLACGIPKQWENSTTAAAPDDGTRVRSWVSHSYEKNTGHNIVNDKGNIYDFKTNYGEKNYKPFSVLKRNHETGEIEAYTAVQTRCHYNHNSTIYGEKEDGLVRVDTLNAAKNQSYSKFSSPGMFYMRPNYGYDILICFTAPEDGTYNLYAGAQRSWPTNQVGVVGTGSRFFVEHNGSLVTEEIDESETETKPIVFNERLELQKGDTVYFGHDPIDGENPVLASYGDDPVIKYFYLEKVGAEKKSTKDTTHIELQMAKNELESFQISVNSHVDLSGLYIEHVSKNVDGISIEYLEEHNHNVNNMIFPDAITDSDGTFDVTANETKTMLVRFKSAKDVQEGDHTFTFELRSATGFVLETFTVELTVWNFVLPDERGSGAATAIYRKDIALQEGIGEEQIDEYYKLYYDKLLEYGMSAYSLPYDVLDERAEAYMSDPRVKSFMLDAKVSDETLMAYNEKLKSNPVWLEKAFFYPLDEPQEMAQLTKLAELCTRLKTYAPDIRITCPFFTNIPAEEGKDQVDFMAEHISLWCPKSACWDSGYMHSKVDFGDRMEEMKKQGDKIWWYVCWEPCYPYCNLQINELGIQHRTLFWQQYDNGVDGLLYWCSNYWSEVSDIWTDGASVKTISPDVFGDGYLLYPGAKVGVTGPCASLRLECIRNGLEDFDMLQLAEKYLGKEWVDKQIDKVTKSVTEHTDDAQLFAEVRKTIGDKLSKKF